MPDVPSLSQTAAVLAGLQAGERAWCWFCPQAGEHALQVVPFTEPVSVLEARVGQISLPIGSTQVLGFLSVGEDGIVSIGSPLADAALLGALASWTCAHAEAAPGLLRLRDARLCQVSPEGVVGAHIADPALWSSLPTLPAEGTIGALAQALSRLPESSPHWLWICKRGPSDQPFMVMEPVGTDPDGASFVRQIGALRRRLGDQGSTARGILQRTPRGLVVSTEGSLKPLQSAITALVCAHPVLAALGQATLAQSRGGTLSQVIRLDAGGAAASAQAALLQTSEWAWFWFTSTGPGGGPLLLLSEEREVLSARIPPSSGASIQGQLRRGDRGVEFRSKAPMPGFISGLATWTGAHLSAWPALSVLRGARLKEKTRQGDLVEHRDDEAWSMLPVYTQEMR